MHTGLIHNVDLRNKTLQNNPIGSVLFTTLTSQLSNSVQETNSEIYDIISAKENNKRKREHEKNKNSMPYLTQEEKSTK